MNFFLCNIDELYFGPWAWNNSVAGELKRVSWTVHN